MAPLLEDTDVGAERPDSSQQIRVEQSPRRVRVVVDDVAVADSKRVLLLFEKGHLPVYYFPPEDVRSDLLEPSDKHTRCPYKGEASYWTIKVGDREVPNAVWSYLAPIPEAAEIKECMAFYNEKVDLYVDGELQPRPKSPWS
jgi:uncharacterized protein (DUF427 family)